MHPARLTSRGRRKGVKDVHHLVCCIKVTCNTVQEQPLIPAAWQMNDNRNS